MSLDIERLREIGHRRQYLYERTTKMADLFPRPRDQNTEWDKVRQALKDGVAYNPQFQLPLVGGEHERLLQDMRLFLDWLRPDPNMLQGRLEQAFWDIAHQYYLDEQARSACTPALLTESTAHEHGRPESDLVGVAWKSLRALRDSRSASVKPGSAPEPTLRSETLIYYIQRLLKEAGWTDWRVVPVPKAPGLFTFLRHPEKLIKIRVGDKIPLPGIRRILVDIAVTRLGRAENGEKNDHRLPSLLSDGFWGYSPTDFGLSRFWTEKLAGCYDPMALEEDTACYIAADICLSGSFFDAFSAIQPYVGVDKALELVTRLKRGFQDTALPGCFLYSIVYWKGYHAVKAYLQQHPEDLSILYVGKIGLADISLVRELLDAGVIEWPENKPEDILAITQKIGDEIYNEQFSR